MEAILKHKNLLFILVTVLFVANSALFAMESSSDLQIAPSKRKRDVENLENIAPSKRSSKEEFVIEAFSDNESSEVQLPEEMIMHIIYSSFEYFFSNFKLENPGKIDFPTIFRRFAAEILVPQCLVSTRYRSIMQPICDHLRQLANAYSAPQIMKEAITQANILHAPRKLRMHRAKIELVKSPQTYEALATTRLLLAYAFSLFPLKDLKDLYFRAAEAGDKTTISTLLALKNEHGEPLISVDYREVGKNTALAIAARFGHFELAKFLLEMGANPNIKGMLGRTPYILATINKQEDIKNLMLRFGADASKEDGLNFTGEAFLEARETPEGLTIDEQDIPGIIITLSTDNF